MYSISSIATFFICTLNELNSEHQWWAHRSGCRILQLDVLVVMQPVLSSGLLSNPAFRIMNERALLIMDIWCVWFYRFPYRRPACYIYTPILHTLSYPCNRTVWSTRLPSDLQVVSLRLLTKRCLAPSASPNQIQFVRNSLNSPPVWQWSGRLQSTPQVMQKALSECQVRSFWLDNRLSKFSGFVDVLHKVKQLV